MSRLALKQEVSRDPSRAALADAIARLTERRVERDRIKAAFDAAEQRGLDLYPEIDAAEVAVREATALQRDELVASVMRGDEVPTNRRLSEAEARLAAARQQQAAIREARKALRADLDSLEASVHLAEGTVAEHARIVLWQAMPDLIRAAEPVRRQLRQMVEVLKLITDNRPHTLAPNDPRSDYEAALSFMRPVLMVATDSPSGDAAAWAAVFDSLLTDPDSPLPSIG